MSTGAVSITITVTVVVGIMKVGEEVGEAVLGNETVAEIATSVVLTTEIYTSNSSRNRIRNSSSCRQDHYQYRQEGEGTVARVAPVAAAAE